MNKTFIYGWMTFYWLSFGIQLVPFIFGGIINVLLYLLIFLLLVRFSNYRVRPNVGFGVGVILFIVMEILFYNDKNKIYIAGFGINYETYKTYFWLLGLLSGLLFVKIAEEREITIFSKYFVLVTLINCVSNIYINTFVDKNASKLAGKTKGLQFLGISDFNLTYSLAIVIPVLIYLLYKAERRKKWFYLLLTGIGLLSLYKSSFLIALLAVLFGICLFIYISLPQKVRIIATFSILFFVIVVILNRNVIFDVMISISGKIDNKNISTRIYELVTVFRDGREPYDGTIRLLLYRTQIEMIIKHPVLGSILTEPEMYAMNNGHSTVLDLFCGYGVVVTSIIIAGFHSIMIGISRRIGKEGKKAFWSCYGTFVFIALFNPVLNGYLLLATVVVVPYVLIMQTEINEGGNE